MEEKWCLYVHVVPKELSGYNHDKYYFGITSRKPHVRWGHNGYNYRNIVFKNAIEKYGWDNIKHIVLLNDLSKECAEECEKYLIDKFHTRERKYGYNRSEGGTGGNNKPTVPVYMYDLNGNYLREFESQSAAAKFLGCHRNNIYQCCKLERSTHGYMFRNFKKDHLEKYIRKTQQNILQLSLDDKPLKVFYTLKDAAVSMNTSNSNIVRNIRKESKFAKGYHWQYLDTYLKENNISDKDEFIKKLNNL